MGPVSDLIYIQLIMMSSRGWVSVKPIDGSAGTGSVDDSESKGKETERKTKRAKQR